MSNTSTNINNNNNSGGNTPPSNKNKARKSPVEQIHVISAQEIKSLDVLSNSNIVSCENFMRTTNATHEKLPLVSWMSSEMQFIVGEKLKNAGVADCENWKTKPYLTWLFPTLKQLFPSNTNYSRTDSVNDRIAALKKNFAKIDIADEVAMHNKIVKRLLEINELPEAQALKGKELKATMAKLFDSMTSIDHPSSAADRLKELVKRKGPKTIKEFIEVYLFEFDVNRQTYLAAQPFLKQNLNSNNNNNNKNFKNNKNEKIPIITIPKMTLLLQVIPIPNQIKIKRETPTLKQIILLAMVAEEFMVALVF